MGSCSECGEAIDVVSGYNCRRCGRYYCSDHRLPEQHACAGNSHSTKPGTGKLRSESQGSSAGLLDDAVAVASLLLAPFWLIAAAIIIGLNATTVLLDIRVLLVLIVVVPAGLIGVVGVGVLGSDDVSGTPAEPIVSAAEGAAGEIDVLVSNAAAGERDFNQTKTELMILNKTNEIREGRGLPPLRWNDHAARVAQNHATDMAENDYVSHTNSRGEGQLERYNLCDGGENIAQTYFDETFTNYNGEPTTHTDADDVATGAVRQWMNSPPHREDGLLGPWMSAGVGIAVDGNDVYVVMGFCNG